MSACMYVYLIGRVCLCVCKCGFVCMCVRACLCELER